MNEYVQVACLPNPKYPNYPLPGKVAIAVGWGLLDEFDEDLAFRLNNVRINVYPSSFCYNVSVESPKDWNRQICAGMNLIS